jgi:hypothetical protein
MALLIAFGQAGVLLYAQREAVAEATEIFTVHFTERKG